MFYLAWIAANCFVRSINANGYANPLARNHKNIKVIRAGLPSILLNTFRALLKPDIFIISFRGNVQSPFGLDFLEQGMRLACGYARHAVTHSVSPCHPQGAIATEM